MNRVLKTFPTALLTNGPKSTRNLIFVGQVCVSSAQRAKETKSNEDEEGVMKRGLIGVDQNIMGSLRRPKKRERSELDNRNVPIPWETSIRYMNSETYKENYGQWKVWELFRRQHGRQQYRVPYLTRVSCIGEDGYIKYASPCPICRDRFLVLHYRNVKLLQQFISPFTGEVIEPRKTNLCQKKHEELLVAYHLAKDYGTMTFHIPQVEYDYSLYYPEEDIIDLDLPKIEEKESIALREDDDEIMKRIKSIEEYGYWHKHSYISHP